jgi:DNA-binding FadR family transcriptional regulator
LNIDLSIHRMAFREAETLGMAQMLVARKRQELELKVARQTVTQGTEAAGATIDQALKDMQDRSEEYQRELLPPTNDSGVLVNKTA